MALSKPLPRQILFAAIKLAVEQAIRDDDHQYGKQLSSVMERKCLRLRSKFGGTPLWDSEAIR